MYDYWCVLAALKPDCIAGRIPRLVATASSNEGIGRWCSTGESTVNVHAWWPVKRQASKEASLPAKHSCCALISLSCSMLLLVDGLWWTSTAIRYSCMYQYMSGWTDQVQLYCLYDCMCSHICLCVFHYMTSMPCGHNFSIYICALPLCLALVRLTYMHASMHGNYLANFQ